MTLRKYQERIKNHIIDNDGAAVFAEMGTGKTLATLSAIYFLIYEDLEINNVLIIAPKRVSSIVWPAEIKKWGFPFSIAEVKGTPKQRMAALYRNVDIHIMGRDNVPWLEENHPRNFNMLVVDESSSFKNPKSKRFKALRKMAFKRVVLLTGTPSPKSLMDLWSQFFLLDRGDRLEKTITKFRRLYFTPDQTNGHIVYSYKLRRGAEELINKKISDVAISLESKDYLELPPQIVNDVYVDFTDKLKKDYKELKKEMILNVSEGELTALTAAALTNKLRQFCSGEVYDEKHNVHHIHDLKLDALDEIIESGENILLAWEYKHERDRILARYDFARELKTDEDVHSWNRGEIRLLIVHPASAAHGLNLQTGGHNIVWFSVTYNLELYLQFNARLLRSGQTKPVIVHRIMVRGSVEEKVVMALEHKTSVQEMLMGALKNTILTE